MSDKIVVASGSFDNLRSPHVRFLEEASKLGEVHVLLWSDDTVAALEGRPPKLPQEERLYLLRAVRYVKKAELIIGPTNPDAVPPGAGPPPDIWAVEQASDNARKRIFCASSGMEYIVFGPDDLRGFPFLDPVMVSQLPPRKKVVVTGCYDWFHSGHVRFFEEVSGLGDLYVVVGHDENVRLLKGEGHPLFPQDERRYMVGSVRYVKQALVSTGHGWMDAEPEIERLKPDIYVVNEDGDKPEKRAFCETHGLQYVVLKRTPKEGLPRRASTDLRGF